MSYKIVQTVERGKLVLTAVPEKWEKNGTLYWPRRKVEELLKNQFSCPEESWTSMQCVLKRSGITSLENAQIEITQMSSTSDTEGELNDVFKQRECTPSGNIAVQECFNDLADACVNNSQYEIDQTQNTIILHRAEIDQQGISQKIDNLLQTTEIIQENQKILFEYVQSVETKLLMKMSHLSTQFDEYVKRTTEVKIQETNDFKPISDKEELDAFEDQLKDPTIMSSLKNKLSVVCGSGKGRGSNNAYALVDVMFTRKFMTICSWAGGSKRTTSKICFKVYTRTINFFYELVRESDKTYTKIECENFFKNVMRHAETRNKIKLLRTSSSKSRPKRRPHNKNNDSQVLQEIQQNEQSLDLSSNLVNNDLNKENSLEIVELRSHDFTT